MTRDWLSPKEIDDLKCVCGSKNVDTEEIDHFLKDYCVRCDVCGRYTKSYPTERKAYNAWIEGDTLISSFIYKCDNYKT